jgi:beta-lactamase class A
MVRGLILLLLAAALWKLLGLAWETVEHWRFFRPPLVEGQAARAIAPRADETLQKAIDQELVGVSGSAAVYVWDLSNGSSASALADRQFPAASLVKIPILVEVLRQERLGRLSPDTRLEIKPEHWTDGAGVLQSRVGERYTVAELTRLMVVDSDNIAARVLMDRLGVDTINDSMAGLGLSHTVLAPLADGRDAEREPHRTSARDMAALLGLIASGELVDVRTSEQGLQLLEAKQAHSWLAQELPWWAKVAHKWGALPGIRHDVGVVYTPRGRYVVAILTENLPPDEATNLITRLSRVAFDRLGADPP